MLKPPSPTRPTVSLGGPLRARGGERRALRAAGLHGGLGDGERERRLARAGRPGDHHVLAGGERGDDGRVDGVGQLQPVALGGGPRPPRSRGSRWARGWRWRRRAAATAGSSRLERGRLRPAPLPRTRRLDRRLLRGRVRRGHCGLHLCRELVRLQPAPPRRLGSGGDRLPLTGAAAPSPTGTSSAAGFARPRRQGRRVPASPAPGGASDSPAASADAAARSATSASSSASTAGSSASVSARAASAIAPSSSSAGSSATAASSSSARLLGQLGRQPDDRQRRIVRRLGACLVGGLERSSAVARPRRRRVGGDLGGGRLDARALDSDRLGWARGSPEVTPPASGSPEVIAGAGRRTPPRPAPRRRVLLAGARRRDRPFDRGRGGLLGADGGVRAGDLVGRGGLPDVRGRDGAAGWAPRRRPGRPRRRRPRTRRCRSRRGDRLVRSSSASGSGSTAAGSSGSGSGSGSGAALWAAHSASPSASAASIPPGLSWPARSRSDMWTGSVSSDFVCVPVSVSWLWSSRSSRSRRNVVYRSPWLSSVFSLSQPARPRCASARPKSSRETWKSGGFDAYSDSPIAAPW